MEKGKKVHNFAFGYDFSEEFLKDKCKSLYSWVFWLDRILFFLCVKEGVYVIYFFQGLLSMKNRCPKEYMAWSRPQVVTIRIPSLDCSSGS